jgi:eukaryotic-like serine/threonine-protein kinase
MGEIFLARLEGAEGFEKLYVVKRILPHLADDARFRQMLISEAQIAAKMAHGNICQVYELGETQGQLYIVMEYLEGITLLPLLRRSAKTNTQLEFGLVAAIVQQTCDALHYAHELKDRDGESLGLVHRDVTPSNIFLTESGVSKVLDFGIAKARGATSTKTEDGAVKGKYAYMAPEQLRGGAIDRRVDLFALGVVIYETLALRRLFQRKTDYLTFRAVMEQPIPDIRRYRPDIPDPIANVLVKALEREPDQRFDTARQFGGAMLDAMSEAGLRPWSQGDIGDMIKSGFAEQIGKRSQQVQTAVQRSPTTSGGVSSRVTMPLIAQEAAHEGDDDDEFPSVETDVDSTPQLRATTPQNDRPVTDPFGQTTPPPFAAETTGSAPALRPLQGTPVAPTNNAPIVVVGQRSIMWPILAVAMILVAGGALFLVWKQMNNQPLAAPPVIIQQERAPENKELASDAPVLADGSGGVEKPTVVHEQKRPKHFATYDQAISSRKLELTSCVQDHGDGIKEKMHAQVIADRSGKTVSVQISPPAANAARVGACLRNVIMGIPFPSSASDQNFGFDLQPKS